MRKHPLHFAVGLFALLAITAGCAITDYDGIPDHTTEAEAKLWGKEVSFSGSGAGDGTYSYTVKYGNTAWNTINTYRNPVVSSFSRDGLVDRDGDDIQGRSGDNGGKFANYIVSRDNVAGTCGFGANVKQDFSGGSVGVFLCINGFSEEVDRDLELQSDFASLDDLASQIWTGSLGSTFTADLTSITLNGTSVDLVNALSLDMSHNGMRPINMTVDLSSPGGQELMQAILDETVHGEATSVGLGLSGGLSINLPAHLTVAFDHDAISAALQ